MNFFDSYIYYNYNIGFSCLHKAQLLLMRDDIALLSSAIRDGSGAPKWTFRYEGMSTYAFFGHCLCLQLSRKTQEGEGPWSINWQLEEVQLGQV